jgi:rhodanese-related sulfurtransferase
MQDITVEELKSRIDAGEKLNVIDVREPGEYAEYNMGAKLIPLGQVMGMQLDELEDLKDEEIIVHCKAGKRSMQACMFMEQMGFTNLKSLVGGADAWKEKYGDTKVN